MPRPRRVILKINQPETLYGICVRYVATNLDQTVSYEERGLRYVRPDTLLTADIMNDILEAYYDSSKQLNDSIMNLFKDSSPLRITRLNLSNSECTGESLKSVALQPITHLSITHEHFMQNPEEDIPALKSIAPTLISLCIADHLDPLLKKESIRSQIFGGIFTETDDSSDVLEPLPANPVNDPEKWLLNAPNLQSLTLHRFAIPDSNKDKLYRSMFYHFLSRFSRLVELNIFGRDCRPCRQHLLFNNLNNVVPHLTSVSLSDVFPQGYDIRLYADELAQLQNLRHLDISRSTSEEDVHNPPSVCRIPEQHSTLNDLIKKLPLLTSLDLSGTHLAEPTIGASSDPIPALGSLPEGREFHFLGLYLCPRKPCRKSNLPAKVVTGTSTCKQIEEALRRYKDRESFAESLMMWLYNLLLEFNGTKELSNPARCLLDVCWVMRYYTRDVSVMTSATAALFYIVRDNAKTFCSFRQIHEVVDTLCIVLRNSLHESSLMKNILLTFTIFDLPDDVRHRFKDMVELMLRIIRLDGMEYLNTKKYAIDILNSLACRVDDEDKKRAGELGIIEEMMRLIVERTEDSTKDSVLEKAWSVLWNVTDETPENCKRFMDGEGVKSGGMKLFHDCYHTFCEPSDQESECLLRNMLGLLGNIAEVPSLRMAFRDTKYLQIFENILMVTEPMVEDDAYNCKNIEVPYNTAGIVSHLASDGPNVVWGTALWRHDKRNEIPFADEPMNDGSDFEPSLRNNGEGMIASGGEFDADLESDIDWRQVILDAMVQAIQRWTIQAERLINYRSLSPIIKLLQCDHTWEVRYWAIWALCNLTTFRTDKYCQLILDEKSISFVQELYNMDNRPEIKNLAEQVLTNYKNWADSHNKSITLDISISTLQTDS